MALLYRMGTGNGSGGDLKPYTVNFECASGYIGQTLTMTYKGTPHAGEAVDNVSGTVGSDGTLTLYPMHSGIWECSCYSSVTGTTMTKTIDLSYWGIQPTVTFEDTPNGATVTPTDDVQTWLHCANVWDKTDLTTIDDVIADTTTLNTLISDNNASDYLVRSTTFATDVCNNESAMTYIGLIDYCANKLLADSTWIEAICNSAYFEKVLNVKVPTMTSNTAPSGQAIADSEYPDGDLFYAYKAFDGDDSSPWCNARGNTGYIGYKFPKKVRVNKLCLITSNDINSPYTIKDFDIYGSDNGTDWSTPIYSGTKTSSTKLSKQNFNINNNKSYLYYKVQAKNTHNGAYTTIGTVQFYGREEA